MNWKQHPGLVAILIAVSVGATAHCDDTAAERARVARLIVELNPDFDPERPSRGKIEAAH